MKANLLSETFKQIPLQSTQQEKQNIRTLLKPPIASTHMRARTHTHTVIYTHYETATMDCQCALHSLFLWWKFQPNSLNRSKNFGDSSTTLQLRRQLQKLRLPSSVLDPNKKFIGSHRTGIDSFHFPTALAVNTEQVSPIRNEDHHIKVFVHWYIKFFVQ